tara:strand:+ start:943 stop:1470 length:528 start_codon:yes stop_codon:yes gene_type:complete
MAILDKRKNQYIEDKDTRVSVGIDLPFANVPNKDGYFTTTKTTVDSIKNNIKLLLQTERGERVFQPNLGVDIRSILFEPLTEDITIQIENSIVDALELWMPFVELKDIQISENENQVNVQIGFDIKRASSLLPSTTQEMEVVDVSFERVSDGGGNRSSFTQQMGIETVQQQNIGY